MDLELEWYIEEINKAVNIYTSTILLFKENTIVHKDLIEHLHNNINRKINDANSRLAREIKGT